MKDTLAPHWLIVACLCVSIGSTLVECAGAQNVVGATTVACNGSGNRLVVLDDGAAYLGTDSPCAGCPPTDSLFFSPAPFGNVLVSAGRAGDRLVAVFNMPSVCGYLVGFTEQGYILLGTPEQPWGSAMEGQSVFQRLGMPSERVVGGGNDGSAILMLTELGRVISVAAQGPQFFFPRLKGQLPYGMPTPAAIRSWGKLKASFR